MGMGYAEIEERLAIREMDEYPTLSLARVVYPTLVSWSFTGGRTSRRLVLLVFANGKVVKVNYARFLYQCWNGIRVPKGYHVDHINDIRTDDRLSNLQILSASDNSKKQQALRRKAV